MIIDHPMCQVEKDGEAGSFFPDLQGGDLVVAVGTTCREDDNPADELLRQLMTLPRPVTVEFYRRPAAPSMTQSSDELSMDRRNPAVIRSRYFPER